MFFIPKSDRSFPVMCCETFIVTYHSVPGASGHFDSGFWMNRVHSSLTFPSYFLSWYNGIWMDKCALTCPALLVSHSQYSTELCVFFLPCFHRSILDAICPKHFILTVDWITNVKGVAHRQLSPNSVVPLHITTLYISVSGHPCLSPLTVYFPTFESGWY